jgi:hypothetical protein
MSTKNQGTWFERDLVRICNAYRGKRTMDLEKVEPPTRVVKRPPTFQPEILRLANPFLDFVGTWTAQGGRAIFLEAKSTAEPRLPLRTSGGLSESQHDALLRWADSGAAVGVLWGHREDVRFVPLIAIAAQLAAGVKHLKWENATPIPAGVGWIRWDFAAVLAQYCPRP